MNNQMASYQLLKNNHLYERQNPRWSTRTSRGGSKAQLCLHKILQIISTIPPEDTSKPTPFNYTSKVSVNNVENEHKGLDIDLNISEHEPEEESESSTVIEEKKADNDVGLHIKGEEGFMGLLIEAAKLIFGEFKDDNDSDDGKQSLSSSEDSPKTRLKRKKAFWALDFCEEVTDASPPVVRSKRGRVQVLPCKYRDSVLEPLTRFSRKRSVVVGNKRRSR